MKLIFIALAVLVSSFFISQPCSSQDSSLPVKRHLHPPPLPVVPQFPGGKDALASYIRKHTCYPSSARKHHISGIIEVDFVVAKDGSLKNISVLKPLGYGCDEEALRVVKKMPRWEPGRVGRDS